MSIIMTMRRQAPFDGAVSISVFFEGYNLSLFCVAVSRTVEMSTP